MVPFTGSAIDSVLLSPSLGSDDGRKGAVSYYLCGFAKRKRGAVALELPGRNYLTFLCGKGHNVTCCLLLSPWIPLEMGHYFKVADEKCQKAVAQGANEERSQGEEGGRCR